MQKEVHNGHQPMHPSQNFQCVWNGMDPNLSLTSSPSFRKGAIDPYGTLPESPEPFNELNDSGWSDESLKQPNLSPTHYTVASVYSDDAGYSSLSVNSFSSSGVSSSATSMPLPIPGAHAAIAAIPEDLCQSQPTQCAPQMAVYPYPVYAVPSMYLVCRDGSSLPVNIGAWGSQDTGNGEMASGIPSVFFNTPPTGMSPPVATWIPATVANYSTSWTPGMTTTVAFSPPVEMNHYHPSLFSPPWNPQSGIYVPPPTAVAYQMPSPVQPRLLPPESMQN